MDSYDNFDLIGDENLMQDAFKFDGLDTDPGCCFSTREGDWDPFSASASGTHTSTTNDPSIWSEELLNSIVGAEMVMECDVTDQLEGREAQMGSDKDNSGISKSVIVFEKDQSSILSKEESPEDIIMCSSENPGVKMVIGGKTNAQTHEVERQMGPIKGDQCSILSKGESPADIIMCSSEYPGVEMVIGGESNVQIHEIERVIGPIEGNQCSLWSKGESQVDIIMRDSENSGVQLVIGGESNIQTHEIETEIGPAEYISENLKGEMVTKEEIVIETTDIEADSGCELHDSGPLGDCSPETESVIDKLVGSCLMEMNNKTEEAEKNITGKNLTECNSEKLRCEAVVACGSVAATECNSVNVGGEMVSESDGNNELDEGECVRPTAKTLKSEIVTEGGSNAQPSEKESHVGAIVDVSESLLDEALVERGIEDLSGLGDQQVGPASPSCENLSEGAEVVTIGDINNQGDEVDCQVGPTKLLCRPDGSDGLNECIGTSQSSILIQVSTYEVHEVPQGQKNNQKEEIPTTVSHSEKCFEQVGPSELQKSVDEKSCTVQLELPSLETGMKDEYGRKLSISPVFSLCEASVVKVDFKCASPDAGLLSSSSPATYLTNDKPGVHLMENITSTKEAVKKTTEEYCSGDCGAHTLELTPGGCSSRIELTEEPTFEHASVEKHDEYEEALPESVLILSNCKVDNTASCKNLESNLGKRMDRDDTSELLSTSLACENAAVVEAVPESPICVGNTKGLHNLSDDAATTGGLQAIQQIQVNHVMSDSMEQTREEIIATFENSISVLEMPSSVTELVCQSDSLSEVIKETTETVPDPELHGPRDCIRELRDRSHGIRSVEVKAVESLDRTINEEATVNDNISENSIMNGVRVEDNRPEPSLVKLLSEHHRDASFVGGTQETDSSSISFGCVEKKGDEETIDHDISEEAEILNDNCVNDVCLTLLPVEISSECHADAGSTDSTLIHSHSDDLEQNAEDGALSVNLLLEKSTEVNNAVNAPTELDLSVGVDVEPRSLVGKINFEFNQDTNSIDEAPIPLENTMEYGKFSGNLLSEESTEENYKSTPTVEDAALSFSPVKITPASDMDAGRIDLVPVDKIKNVKDSGAHLIDRGEDKSSELSEIINGTKIEDIVSSKTNVDVTSVDFVPIQSDCMIDGGKSSQLRVVQSSVLVGKYSGAITQRSEPMIGSLVEGMRPECESIPVGKQGGAHMEAISTDCGPIQYDMAVCLSRIDGEDLEAIDQSDTMVISSEEVDTGNKLTSQGMIDLVEAENKPTERSCDSLESAEASSADKLFQNFEIDDDGLASKLDDVLQGTLTESKDPKAGLLEFGNGKRAYSSSEYSLQEANVTGVSMGDLSPNVVPGMMKEAQVKFIVLEKLAKEDENNFAYPSAHTSAEREDIEATYLSDTMVVSSGKKMETRTNSTSQEMVELVEAEKKEEVIGASLENAEASSADKLFNNSEIGGDGSAPKLEDVVQCTLTESKDPKSGFVEYGNGKRTCSSSECSLPEENITGVPMGDSSPDVGLGTMKGPQVKFIIPEKMVREDKNSYESPSTHTLGTLTDDRPDDFERTGVSGSNVPSPSIPEDLISGGALNSRTCVETNSKLPDLNMPQSAEPSQEPLTEAQKMQLRAQIFVYGSLVDGSIPAAAYMERSFGESERCIWEPVWHAYSDKLKTRSLPSSGKTPTLSGSGQKKTATRTIQNGTHLFSPLLDWSPSFSSNFQSSSWYFSPQSGTRNEPLQPVSVRFESENRSSKRKSFADETRSPAHNSVCRNANFIAAATNGFTSDFIVQTLPGPVNPVLTYARHSEEEKPGQIQAGHSCTHGSRVQLTHTFEDIPDTVVPACSLEKETNIVPICSLDKGRSVFPCAALTVFQPQSASGYYQIAPQSPSCVFLDQLSRQAESSSGASEIIDQSPSLREMLTADKSSSTDPQDQVATAVVTVEAVMKAAAAARLAAEAARLASEAALQAKLLADEAMGLMDPNPGMNLSMFQAERELEMVTPVKILKSKDKVHGSQAILSAMREASRRQVKLASAASKRAENMDTTLRAAEMAAEAVAQVGQVVMMGDPLPFSIADMVEAIGGIHLRAVQSGETDVSRRDKVVDMGLATHRGAVVVQADEGLVRETIPLSFGQRDLTGTEDISVETGGHVIKKGSHVEVTGDKQGHLGVWFGAIVLDLKDGMAHVRYTDLPSCKEGWVPLERESGAAPMVRLAHPVTTLKYDGSRKRRREDLSSYSWSIGDHVDARMRDGWWECIIAQKHADEANYTVHFPVRGESLVVGECDLRPSLVWKEGSWVEWAREKESSKFSKGDSPFEKRQRVDPNPHDVDIVIPKPNPYRSTKIPRAALHQYARDSTSLSIGANQKSKESFPEPQRTGPRVCFGVPRPNKKTKFLEVAEVSRSKLANDRTVVPNSSGLEKQQKPLTKIPGCSKESLNSYRCKGLEGNLTNVRGKKPTTEPVTRKNTLSSSGLGGQNGASRRKGVLNVGSGTSNRTRETEVADAGSTEPRRSGRNVKPTPKLLERVVNDHVMSKIPTAGSAKGPVPVKGSTNQRGKRKAF